MSGSLATCLVLCVVWLAADCGSADLPHNEAADGALNSASDGALNSAGGGALNSASVGTSSAILVGRSVGSHVALSNTTATSVSLEETAFVYREDDTDVSEPAVIQDSHSGAETQGFYSNGWPTSASSFAGTTRGPKELQIRLLAPRLGTCRTVALSGCVTHCSIVWVRVAL